MYDRFSITVPYNQKLKPISDEFLLLFFHEINLRLVVVMGHAANSNTRYIHEEESSALRQNFSYLS